MNVHLIEKDLLQVSNFKSFEILILVIIELLVYAQNLVFRVYSPCRGRYGHSTNFLCSFFRLM